MMEEWKDILGQEGYYQVSNFGRVRSLDRIVIDSLKREKHLKGRILKPDLDGCYYYMHKIRGKNRRVHDLVASAFLGKKPSGKVVDHIDRNKLNNRAENIRYCTQFDNMKNVEYRYRGSSKLKGVHWNKSRGKWIGQVTVKGKTYCVGGYDYQWQAYRACRRKERDVLTLLKENESV